MKTVILTGMSGAGKSTAFKMMEDIGFYCVDNLPVPLFERFIELSEQNAKLCRTAVGIDVRNGQSLEELHAVLDRLQQQGKHCEILFLDAKDKVLVRRYKETRRRHPLSGSERVDKGIAEERKRLDFLKKRADYIIDTSHLLTRELKTELTGIFVEGQKFNNLVITILSFGFKYGIPADADLVFDVRFLPNPYYEEDLRMLSGNDAKIQDFVLQYPKAHIFLDKLTDMINFLLPNYTAEGKNQLVIAIGCTGGKHRSVTLANELFKSLKKNEQYGVKIEHRDIGKDTRKKSLEREDVIF